MKSATEEPGGLELAPRNGHSVPEVSGRLGPLWPGAPTRPWGLRSPEVRSIPQEDRKAVAKGKALPGRPRSGGSWTEQEEQRLRETYGLRDEATIARELGRSVESVRRAAQRLFRAPLRRGEWADRELAQLKRYLGATSVDVIARILGRREEDVRGQIEILARTRKGGQWSREELLLLRRIFGTRTDEDLGHIFGRTVESVRRTAKRLALSKDKAFLRRIRGVSSTRMPRWRPDELEVLCEHYPNLPNLEVAHRLGRSVKSVVSKAHHMGLRKNTERLQAMGRENVALRYRRSSHGAAAR